MKQLTIISGKGGTGKTTIAAAFASLAENAVIADCDVDAADMHLILDPKIKTVTDFYGLKEASIDSSLCIKCGLCKEKCRFGAITEDIVVDSFECEGCGVCAYTCPENAITMVSKKAGEAYLSETRFGPMAHAKLNAGEEASGKLVSVVRENAKELADRDEKELIIIDGPPGTGCSVIASITGVDLVMIVTEPSVSGIHDLDRVLDVTTYFGIPAVICINEYDINEENASIIEEYCRENEIDVAGKLPFSKIPNKAMIQEKTVIEHLDNEQGEGEIKDEFSEKIREMWQKVLGKLNS